MSAPPSTHAGLYVRIICPRPISVLRFRISEGLTRHNNSNYDNSKIIVIIIVIIVIIIIVANSNYNNSDNRNTKISGMEFRDPYRESTGSLESTNLSREILNTEIWRMTRNRFAESIPFRSARVRAYDDRA